MLTDYYRTETIETDKGIATISENLESGYTTLTIELFRNLQRVTRSATTRDVLDLGPIALIY